ncbi:MAG: sigma-70 family RNA polymerase sigma factor [bacterium]|nr:sigma-70 family RNA polymerase sigma factor [bacterium]
MNSRCATNLSMDIGDCQEDELALPNDSDRYLMERIASGCQESLAQLISRYGALVNQTCRNICGPEAELAGLASEVFWELWVRAERFQEQRGSLRTYLMLIARSRAIDYRRSQRSRQESVRRHVQLRIANDADPDPSIEPCSIAIRDEECQQARKALRKLDPPQRQAIELAFFEGLTHEQVAQRMQAPLGTTKSRIRLGLKQLKKYLDS